MFQFQSWNGNEIEGTAALSHVATAQVHFNINYLDNTIVNNKLSALAKLFYRTISYHVCDLVPAAKTTMAW